MQVLARAATDLLARGGYFSTPTNGCILAYPAAPFAAYGGVRFHF